MSHFPTSAEKHTNHFANTYADALALYANAEKLEAARSDEHSLVSVMDRIYEEFHETCVAGSESEGPEEFLSKCCERFALLDALMNICYIIAKIENPGSSTEM